MLRNYLTAAMRSLLGQKLQSIINIGGLAIGLAATILILLFVRYEMSYDDWIPESERIFKIELTIPIPGRDTLLLSAVPPAVVPEMQKYFSDQIENATRVLQVNSVVHIDDSNFDEKISFVDANFFDVLDLRLLAGNRADVSNNVSNILISESLALKFFGDSDPVGKVIAASLLSIRNSIDPNAVFRVVGIFEDIPENSHMPFQIFALIDPIRFQGINDDFGGAWADAAYVKFRSGVNPEDVQSRFTEFYRSVAPPRGDESEMHDYRVDRQFDFINVADVHLYSDKLSQLKPIGDIDVVISFAIAAGLILLIAALNFTNLSTAQALRRAKEMSMRKVLGSTRSQLIRQFLGESVLVAIVALIVALLIAETILPFFANFLGKEMSLNLVGDPLQTGILILASVLVGALGGIYPAVFLASYRPSQIMASSSSKNKGSPVVRQILVICQFAISIGLIIATVVVNQQTSLLRNKDLGFDKQQKLAIVGLTDDAVAPMESTIREEMLSIPGVMAAALVSDEFPLQGYNDSNIEMPGSGITGPISTDVIYVDENFFDVYGIEPLAGRLYSEKYSADTLVIPEKEGVPWTRNAIVTETFIRAAGLRNPEEVLGTQLVISDYGGEGKHLHAKLVGVVADLHLRSLRERTNQLVFFASDSVLDVMTLSIVSDDLPVTLTEIDRVWNNAVPQMPIKRYFVEDRYEALYAPEERRSRVFMVFSVLAILVACLGLFGLASFATEQRTLEIGIRKVHGARVRDILLLIGTQFMTSVVVANVIAWPIVYLIMRSWLNGYQYRIDLGPLVFASSGLLAIVLAWLTVGWRVYRVARTNPVRALRWY
jgi:putative ABC transport system permease protein